MDMAGSPRPRASKSAASSRTHVTHGHMGPSWLDLVGVGTLLHGRVPLGSSRVRGSPRCRRKRQAPPREMDRPRRSTSAAPLCTFTVSPRLPGLPRPPRYYGRDPAVRTRGYRLGWAGFSRLSRSLPSVEVESSSRSWVRIPTRRPLPLSPPAPPPPRFKCQMSDFEWLSAGLGRARPSLAVLAFLSGTSARGGL